MQSIIKLSEATAIALHAMIYIAKKSPNSSRVSEIATEFSISENHLSKVLQRLVKAGYLISTKGPKGGFVITEEKNNTTFMDVYKVIEGDMPFTTCLFNKSACKPKPCIMGGLISKINNEFVDYFTNTKISDF